MEDDFNWHLDALINLQYITAYGEKNITIGEDATTVWSERFDKYREMAKDFSKNEPDWDESETDYETAIERYCKEKLGF